MLSLTSSSAGRCITGCNVSQGGRPQVSRPVPVSIGGPWREKKCVVRAKQESLHDIAVMMCLPIQPFQIRRRKEKNWREGDDEKCFAGL